MIESIFIKNFRNFQEKEISFSWEKNIIIWKNGKGKSNILEALSLPVWPLVESHPSYLTQKGKNIFFIRYQLCSNNISISYDNETRRKKYMIWSTPSTKQKLKLIYPHIVSFHPMLMNLMYLWPSDRRMFLDEILISSFPTYKNILQNYKKILLNRNKLLKHISENKSSIHELEFWDKKFVDEAEKVYFYRKKISDFFSHNISRLQEYFFWKVNTLSFQYISKVNTSQARKSIEEYLHKNREKEILLRKSLRGPHLDDFDILIDDISLIHFASRWEVKSIILWLKFLETYFIEKYSDKNNILFLIDDFLSELDNEHRDLLWRHVWSRQSIISSIEDFPISWNKIYL